jgi:hypothetical protein
MEGIVIPGTKGFLGLPLVYFFGHQLFPEGLTTDVLLAVLALLLLKQLKEDFQGTTPVWGLITLCFYIGGFPQPAYLGLEIKHLIVNPSLINHPLAVIVFGGCSFLGMYLTVKQIIILVTEFKFMSSYKFILVPLFCFIASFGMALGQSDITSIQGWVGYLLIKHVYFVVYNRAYLILVYGYTVFYTILTTVVLVLHTMAEKRVEG